MKDSDTRETLLNVAEELFADRGLDGVGLREICSRAQANLALPAYYFRSKEGLYQAVLERLVSRALAALGPLPLYPERTPMAQAAEDLRRMVRRLFDMFRAEPRIARLALRRSLERGADSERKVVAPAIALVAKRMRGLVRRAGGHPDDAGIVALGLMAFLLVPFAAEPLVEQLYGAGLTDPKVADRVGHALEWAIGRLLGTEKPRRRRRKKGGAGASARRPARGLRRQSP